MQSISAFSFTCILSSIFLAACGAGSGDTTEAMQEQTLSSSAARLGSEVESPDLMASLEGSWVTGCEAEEDGSAKGTENYTDKEFTIWLRTFGDANCAYSLFDLGLVGNYTLGDTSYSSSGSLVTELDVIGQTLIFKPLDAELVARFNKIEFCDKNDWVRGESRDITTCSENDSSLVNYDIVEFEGSLHYLGINTASLDGRSASRRPVAIDYSVEYSRLPDDELAVQSDEPNTEPRGASEFMLQQYVEKAKSIISTGIVK